MIPACGARHRAVFPSFRCGRRDICSRRPRRGENPLDVKLRAQTGIMRDQVTRHLERARIAARATVVGSVTDVPPVVTGLTRTMEQLPALR